MPLASYLYLFIGICFVLHNSVLIESKLTINEEDWDNCPILGDPGLFENQGCHYTVGQIGIVAAGPTSGMEAEIIVVAENYVMYRIYLDITMVEKHGFPDTGDLYLWAESDGMIQTIPALSPEHGWKEDKTKKNGDDKYREFHYGSSGDYKKKLKKGEKLVDCYDPNIMFAFHTKPNGDCDLYYEPHPPISTCKKITEAPILEINIADIQDQVLYSMIVPKIEGTTLRYQPVPKYEECDTGMIPYKIGEIINKYGQDLFTYRRIKYTDIPARGIVYLGALDQKDPEYLYFHTYNMVSKYHDIDPSKEANTHAYIIDVPVLKGMTGVPT